MILRNLSLETNAAPILQIPIIKINPIHMQHLIMYPMLSIFRMLKLYYYIQMGYTILGEIHYTIHC